MPLSNPSTFKSATDYLGVAYTAILTALDSQVSSSALSATANFRTAVRTNVVAADTDDNDNLADVARAIELTIPSTIGDSLNSAADGLEAYCQAQFLTSMREYFKESITNWTDGFRSLWRHARAEELVCRLGTLARGASVWAYTQDHVTVLDTAMELRVVTVNVASDIVVNLTMTTESGVNQLATARVPAGSVAGLRVPLVGGPAKYVSVSAITITGGTNTDNIEVWLV